MSHRSTSLAPTVLERLSRARADLRMGVPVLFTCMGRSLLVIAAETVAAARLVEFRNLGPVVLAISKHRARTLKVRCYDGDIARIPVPEAADVGWITALTDPTEDLQAPLKGPLIALRDGDADMHRAAIALIKKARLLPAIVAVEVGHGAEFAHDHGLTHINLDLAQALIATASPMHLVVCARIPLEVSEAGRLHVFRPEDGSEEHYAVEIGRPERDRPVLARLHSACFTGDLLGSLKCDCGPQLRAALRQMGDKGQGVLLYLNQEGRGIGLANKMRAYSLQDQGFDTVEANHRLGFEDDERDFRIGANILSELGFSAVRLLTNNPAKITMMQEHGITVTERVPLRVGLNPLNAKYLDTKAKKSGHIL